MQWGMSGRRDPTGKRKGKRGKKQFLARALACAHESPDENLSPKSQATSYALALVLNPTHISKQVNITTGTISKLRKAISEAEDTIVCWSREHRRVDVDGTLVLSFSCPETKWERRGKQGLREEEEEKEETNERKLKGKRRTTKSPQLESLSPLW